jgi:hypothetical protein
VGGLAGIENVANHHLRTLGGKRIGVMPTDPARATGDDGSPIT